MKCSRCQKRTALDNEYDFCYDCMKTFRPMVAELRLAYIHHYMHPEKKTIYVHDAKSKRHVKRDVKGESKLESSALEDKNVNI